MEDCLICFQSRPALNTGGDDSVADGGGDARSVGDVRTGPDGFGHGRIWEVRTWWGVKTKFLWRGSEVSGVRTKVLASGCEGSGRNPLASFSFLSFMKVQGRPPRV
jgi:hypothetical protein